MNSFLDTPFHHRADLSLLWGPLLAFFKGLLHSRVSISAPSLGLPVQNETALVHIEICCKYKVHTRL